MDMELTYIYHSGFALSGDGFTVIMDYYRDSEDGQAQSDLNRLMDGTFSNQEAGMPEDKVMQVSAMADQMLLDSKNPQSAGNRRIEIMVLTKSASDTLYQYFGQHGDKVVQPLVQKLDKQQVLSQRTR